MNRNSRETMKGIFKVILLLHLLMICQSQQINVELNLQEGEQKTVDLTDYFGIITDSFYKENQPNGVKVVNAVEFLDKSFTSPTFDEKDSQYILKTSNKQQLSISIKINNSSDSTQQGILQIDQYLLSKHDVSIIQGLSSQIFNNNKYLNSLSEVILLNKSMGMVMYNSGYSCFFYQIDISENLTFTSTQIQTKENIQDLKSIRVFQIQNDIFWICMKGQQKVVLLKQSSNQIASVSSYNSCDSNSDAVFISNESYYLLKCRNGNNQFFRVFYQDTLAFVSQQSPQLISVQSDNLEQILPQSVKTKIITKTINQQQIYVLEYSTNSSMNSMILYKVSFNQNQSILNVEMLKFNTNVSDNDMLGVFIISQELIAVTTKEQILGFSINKNKLLYNIKLQPAKNLAIISANQIFSTLLLTYKTLSEVVSYKTQEVFLNIPYITVDLSQTQTSPLQFSVRENQNAFNQTANFKINTLSNDKLTISFVNDKINLYQVVDKNNGMAYYSNIEQSIVGSDLQLKLNDFKFDNTDCQVKSILNSINLIPNFITDGITDLDKIVNIYSTYFGTILVQTQTSEFIGFQNIKINTSQDGSQVSVQSLTRIQVSPDSLTAVDKYGIISIRRKDINKFYIPNEIKSDQMIQIDFTQCNSESGPYLFSSDPINNQIVQLCNNKVYLYSYFFNQNLNAYSTTIEINFLDILKQQITNIFLNSNSNTVYITDNQSILAYNYILQNRVGVIQIPTLSDETSRSVILLSQNFIVISQFSNGQNKILVYSYDDFNYSDPKYQRQLLGLTYKLQLSDPTKISYHINKTGKSEYILIPALDSQNKLTQVIFRMNEVSTQNQLYSSIQFSQENDSIQFMGQNFMGEFSKKNLKLTYYTFSYYIQIQLSYQIDNKIFQQNYIQQGQSQLEIINSNQDSLFIFNISKINTEDLSKIEILNSQCKLADDIQVSQLSDAQKVELNLVFQRNLESSYGTVNKNNEGVINLQNNFDSENLQVGKIYQFNDTDAYNANILGWQIDQSPNSLFLQGKTIGRLVNSHASDLNAFDMIQVGDLIATSYKNFINFNNGQSIAFGEDFEGCYLQYDESSVKEKFDEQSQKNIIDMILFALCQNTQDPSIQMLAQIQIQYVPQPSNYQPIVYIISTQQWTSIVNPFNRQTQTLIKITYDTNLGLISAFKQNNSQQFSICLVKVSYQDTSPLIFDCQINDSLKYLKIVYFMWNQDCQCNIFITFDGLIYYGLAKTLDKFQVINLNSELMNQNKNIKPNSQIIGADKLYSYSNSSFLIGYDNNQLFEISLIFNKDKIYESLIVSQYFTEPGYQFAGFTAGTTLKQVMVAMIDQSNLNSYTFFIYKNEQNPYTIVNSIDMEKQDSYNGQIKMFYIDSKCYFLMNDRDIQIGSVSNLYYSQSTNILISSFDDSNNFDQIGFYLTPLGVAKTDQTTIPIQVKVVSNKTYISNLSFRIITMIYVIILII